jgi:ubiquinone/menaquinone biosynthesis C-methylase UbiE
MSLTESGNVNVVGIDPSRSQVERAARRSHGKPVQAVRASAQALPFADNSFDSVVSSCAWKHWPNSLDGLAECVRVTRPGGALVIVEIDGKSTANRFGNFAQQCRMPPGMSGAYVRFAMRTVVGVAPNADLLSRSFMGLSIEGPPTIVQIEDLPFLLATSHVA